MRIQPPKNWPQEKMNFDQFKEYIFNHRILFAEKNKQEQRFMEYFESLIPLYENTFGIIADIITMFPSEYQQPISYILNKHILDKNDA